MEDTLHFPMTPMTKPATDKATLYFQGDFGMGVVKLEVTKLEVTVKPHAQYERGVYATFTPKRARRQRGIVQAYSPNLVILEGWGHPDPDGMFLPEEPGKTEGVTIRRGRYMAHDERWQTDFNAKINAYLEGKDVLLYDFRGHSAGSRGCKTPLCNCPSCESEHDVNN